MCTRRHPLADSLRPVGRSTRSGPLLLAYYFLLLPGSASVSPDPGARTRASFPFFGNTCLSIASFVQDTAIAEIKPDYSYAEFGISRSNVQICSTFLPQRWRNKFHWSSSEFNQSCTSGPPSGSDNGTARDISTFPTVRPELQFL